MVEQNTNIILHNVYKINLDVSGMITLWKHCNLLGKQNLIHISQRPNCSSTVTGYKPQVITEYSMFSKNSQFFLSPSFIYLPYPLLLYFEIENFVKTYLFKSLKKSYMDYTCTFAFLQYMYILWHVNIKSSPL